MKLAPSGERVAPKKYRQAVELHRLAILGFRNPASNGGQWLPTVMLTTIRISNPKTYMQ